jgi:hypothetical protein
MVGWWAKQRVGACIFDLLRVLERAAPVERAKILAMAHVTGYGMFRDPEIRAVIDNPSTKPSDDLMHMFERLEQVNMDSVANGKRLRRNQRNLFGQDIPQFMQDHWVTVQRGNQVWMCTAGAGITPARLPEVRSIWRHLSAAQASVPDAVAQMREMGAKVGELYGDPGANFMAALDVNEAVKFCGFVPAFAR